MHVYVPVCTSVCACVPLCVCMCTSVCVYVCVCRGGKIVRCSPLFSPRCVYWGEGGEGGA